MKLEQLIEIIQQVMPHQNDSVQRAVLREESSLCPPCYSSYDSAGLLNISNIPIHSLDIKRVGVCVAITKDTIKEIENRKIDFIIVHQVEDLDDKTYEMNAYRQVNGLSIGVYGLYLPLDTGHGGLNDTLASIFGIGNVRPIAREMTKFTFGGDWGQERRTYVSRLERGAILGTLQHPLPIDYFIETFNDSPHSHSDKTKLVVDNNSSYDIVTVVILTCPSIDKEFLEQMRKYSPQLCITGKVDKETRQYARKLGISLVILGDYGAHYFGMKQFTYQLSSELVSKTGTRAIFIPNHKKQ